ncbi:MAG: hypothetical protein ACREB9_08565, partial [Thermoplasmata archaeon]
SGTTWAIVVNGTLYAAVAPSSKVVSLPNGTFTWQLGDLPGWHQTSLPYNGSGVVASQPLTKLFEFAKFTFPVTFRATGLPAGNWTVFVNETPYAAPVGDPIVAPAANGTFTYAIADVPGFHQLTLPYEGSGLIAGAPVVEPTLEFTAVLYPVTFVETGLPGGSSWTMNAGGHVVTGSTSSLSVEVGNGTYGFRANSTGYLAIPPAGVVIVTGSEVTQQIGFVVRPPFSSTVTFSESGLAEGAVWTVTFDGVTQVAVAPSTIYFQGIGNGTYPFSVRANGYIAAPVSGNVTVAGADQNVAVDFTSLLPAYYSVTFTALGLPSATYWGVALSGRSTEYSNTSSIEYTNVTAGTYFFEVISPGYLANPSQGPLNVTNASIALQILFPGATFATSFIALDLPSGLN